MFSLVGTIALLVFYVVRVQEIVPALHSITVTHLLLVGFVGLAIDIRLKRVRLPRSKLAKLFLLFMVWSLLAEARQVRQGVEMGMWIALLAPYGLFVLIALGAQSLRSIRALSWVVFGTIFFATLVATHQGIQPLVCVVADANGNRPVPGPPQLCELRRDCQTTLEVEAEDEFACERVGLAGTTSVFGRVRYRGLLEDPNELAWVVNMAFPLFLWLVDRWRPRIKIPVILIVFAIDVTCVIMTKSRGGQQAFLLMVIVLTWRRLGMKGLLAAGVLFIPVLLLGGRDGADAESSSLERLGCWSAGIQMWREHPLLGVGPWRFTEFHDLTAHNTFILTLAEGGPVFLFLWSAMFWQLFRSLNVTRGELESRTGAREPATLAAMLIAAGAPTVVSAFFLSIAYKPALWAFLGLVMAQETLVYDKLEMEPPQSARYDNAAVATCCFALISAIWLYVKIKGV